MLAMLGVHWIDWLIIIVYLVGITGVGVLAVKKVRSATSYFIGDRKFGKFMMMMFTFCAGTHTDQAAIVAAKTFRVGASGIWYEWLWLFCTPFFWLFAAVFRRMRAVTTADFFNTRYSRSVSVLYALMGMLQLTAYIGLLLKTSGAMIAAVTGGAINSNMAIMVTVLVFVVYGVTGGLSAAIFTNLVQGVMTLILSFMLLPFILPRVSGIAGLWQKLPPQMMSIIVPTDISWFYIAIISLNGLIGWVVQPNCMAITSAGKTEMEGRVGVMCGIMIKRVCTIAWAIVGVAAAALYLGKDVDANQVYGLVAHDLLPKGFIGLFIASMLAAVMSCCGSLMVTSSALFTKNLYKPLLVPGRPDRHYMQVGRTVAAIVVLVGLFFAYHFESLVHGLEVAWRIQPVMGIAFFMGLFWRRANPAAAWTATLLTFFTMLFTSDLTMFGIPWNFNAHFADALPAFMLFSGKLYLPWQMIIYLTAGLISFVIVTLLTNPMTKQKLDKFYECIRTPITPNEPEGEPFTLPPGVSPAPRNVLIQNPNWEIPKPNKVSIIGFFAGWAAVAVLITTFFLIMKQ